MTTATVPIAITCPDWCTVSPQDHVAELWASGGVCIHHAADIEVPDPTGHLAPFKEPRYYATVDLSLSTMTRPDGKEAESATFRVDGEEHSLDQMLALANQIHRLVAIYRGEATTA